MGNNQSKISREGCLTNRVNCCKENSFNFYCWKISLVDKKKIGTSLLNAALYAGAIYQQQISTLCHDFLSAHSNVMPKQAAP